MHRRKLFLVLPTSIALLGLLLAGIGALTHTPRSRAAPAHASLVCTGAWSIVSSPNVSNANYNQLYGVAVINRHDAWTVGSSTDATTSVNSSLTEHWNGTSWSIVPSPNVGSTQNQLLAVAKIPHTKQLWAVGFSIDGGGPNHTLIERWDGTSWSVVASPNVGAGNNSLNGVVAISATNAWAVGQQNGSQPLVVHWDGTSWSVFPSPAVTSILVGLTQVPDTLQLWATGGTGSGTLTEHFDGSSWSVVSSPNAPATTGGDFLSGVVALAASDVWAVGQSGTGGNPVFTLTEHWNGTSWSVVSSPNPSSIENVLFAAAHIPGTTHLWAVGLEGTTSTFQTLVERWDGTSWGVVASPNASTFQNFLRGVATHRVGEDGEEDDEDDGDAPASEAWAVGSSTASGLTQTLIEHFC